eukprot:5920761-Amphidinium_carterae.1
MIGSQTSEHKVMLIFLHSPILRVQHSQLPVQKNQKGPTLLAHEHHHSPHHQGHPDALHHCQRQCKQHARHHQQHHQAAQGCHVLPPGKDTAGCNDASFAQLDLALFAGGVTAAPSSSAGTFELSSLTSLLVACNSSDTVTRTSSAHGAPSGTALPGKSDRLRTTYTSRKTSNTVVLSLDAAASRVHSLQYLRPDRPNVSPPLKKNWHTPEGSCETSSVDLDFSILACPAESSSHSMMFCNVSICHIKLFFNLSLMAFILSSRSLRTPFEIFVGGLSRGAPDEPVDAGIAGRDESVKTPCDACAE